MHTISCSNLPTHTRFSSQSSFQFLLLFTDLYLWMLIIIRPLSLLNIVHWLLHTFSYHFLTNALIGFWEQLSAHVTFGAFGQTLFLQCVRKYCRRLTELSPAEMTIPRFKTNKQNFCSLTEYEAVGTGSKI